MTKQFIDKDKSGNLLDGIEFFAVGIVLEQVYTYPSHSGKDLAVKYIDPWGRVRLEWRALPDVELSDLSESDAETLKDAFTRLESL